MTTHKLLFASRAYQSPHTEGGFVHLKDIAFRAAADEAFSPAFLSLAGRSDTTDIEMAGGFSRLGWGKRAAWEFTRALRSRQASAALVHTAHVPTGVNSRLLALISNAGRREGVRYVQTVTGLPRPRGLHERLFWGDAVTCLNSAATAVVSGFHHNVRTIAPVPGPDRLRQRVTVPAEFRACVSGRRVVCFPVVLSRLGDFPMSALSSNLLEEFPDVHLVFACRFGDDRQLRSRFDSLLKRHRERLSVLGAVDWILELFRFSKVVAYPVGDLDGKFNPPLVLLEAALLGAAVVTSSAIDLSESIGDGSAVRVTDASVRAWAVAIGEALAGPRNPEPSTNWFERSYQAYRDLYMELLEGR